LAVACGLVLSLAAACAPMRESKLGATAFSKIKAAEVFAAGLSGIAEKYIDVVAVDDISFEGIRGLGVLDPDLTVSREGGEVLLTSAGHEVIRLKAPGADDVAGWANLTADISLAARQASPELKSADMEAVYEAFFDGVLSNLDIFSRYAGAEEARKNRAKRDGFGGIGIRYRIKDGVVVVSDVLPKKPAAKAGMMKNDRITHVDGKPLKGLSRKAISNMIRGPTHTLVNLKVERKGASGPLTMAMERVHIFLTTVFETENDGILVLRLKSFNQNTARSMAKKLENARARLADGLRGLVLDLRGNPGGLLKQSIKVADLLLTQGKIVSTQGRHAESIHNYEAGGQDLAFGLPVLVLVDGKSASAAEIVAAALQDRDRAVVIGTSSFGKGSVQTVIKLPNDGEITLTWSKLVAPSGYMLHGLGVRPAICTSGLKDGAEEAIKAVMANRSKTEEVLTAWRKPEIPDEDVRNKLRQSCPSQRRSNNLETDIARRLIDDQALYAQALNLSAPTHEARYKQGATLPASPRTPLTGGPRTRAPRDLGQTPNSRHGTWQNRVPY